MPTSRFRAIRALVLAAGVAACGGGAPDGSGLAGTVAIDGSSTVFPILEAVVEEFQLENRGVRVTVGISGTGGGFRRFCAGEIDVADASRPITEAERRSCTENGVEFTAVPIARDGLSIVGNAENDWARCLTLEELRAIWAPASSVTSWADVRADFPAEKIELYGPGPSSGTFDYFTETVNGERGASRPDYQASEDDNVLVQGVLGDRFALGYFGFAYFREHADRLVGIAVDSGAGCVQPTDETIEDGTYAPLSRPLFIYVNHRAAARPEVAAFLRYALRHAPDLIPATGYVPLTAEQYAEQVAALGAITQGEV